MCSVLVTGANRGIGLGIVRELLKKDCVKHVIASCRDPDDADELQQLKGARLSIIKMEIRCDKSIRNAVQDVEKIVGDSGLNLLVNNAGVMHEINTDQKPDREILRDQLEVNAISYVIVIQHFLPLLKKAAKSPEGAKIVNLSSNLGSVSRDIAEQGSTERANLGYSMSKSAVNALSKCMAKDLENDKILSAAYHPGWVRTDMGGKDAPTTVEESAERLVKLFHELSKERNGQYIDAMTGEELPY